VFRRTNLLICTNVKSHNANVNTKHLISLFSCSYRAPIASLDCMEEFQSTNEHLTQGPPQTKEQLLQSLSQQTPLTASNHGPLVSRQSSVTPGLRYRNLGKSGLRVSNVGLGKCPFSSVLPNAPSPELRKGCRWNLVFGLRTTYCRKYLTLIRCVSISLCHQITKY
jgi:hypothetical protein